MGMTMEQQKKVKKGAMVAGAIAGASSLILLNSNAREKVKDTSRNMKDSVNNYTTAIKEDPRGAKDAIIARLQNATEISKETLNKIQNILDTQAKDIKETTQNVVEESKEIKSSVKETQNELGEIKDKATDAKDELVSAKDDVKSNGSGQEQQPHQL
ncbi:hypothetical protein [Gracilibacillus saliphilus]|uniref:hypothetical protein n=1 Tax=Gracilibacillus saliphilus TaxID=543890 RepID=UPI0013D0F5DC|nr:hypothetical protein [Gracilibacillus saliphilus]